MLTRHAYPAANFTDNPVLTTLYDGIICISPTAADIASQYLTAHQTPLLKQPTLQQPALWLAIGKSTQDRLRQFQIKAECAQLETSEGLLQHPALQAPQVKQQNWLIIRGKEGRELLETTLLDRGAQVKHWIVYERRTIIYSKQQFQSAINNLFNSQPGIIATSEVSLHHLMHQWEQHQIPDKPPNQCQLITSSDRMAKIAHTYGFQPIHIANNARDDSLLNSVLK